jgi:hypothetical protein
MVRGRCASGLHVKCVSLVCCGVNPQGIRKSCTGSGRVLIIAVSMYTMLLSSTGPTLELLRPGGGNVVVDIGFPESNPICSVWEELVIDKFEDVVIEPFNKRVILRFPQAKPERSMNTRVMAIAYEFSLSYLICLQHGPEIFQSCVLYNLVILATYETASDVVKWLKNGFPPKTRTITE